MSETTEHPTLSEFLLKRIGEDEAPWKAMPPGSQILVRAQESQEYGVWMVIPESVTIATPKRVLAECEAKRRIVDQWRDLAYEVEQAESLGDYDAAPVATAFAYEQAVKVLALVYAEHPNYREEWRP